jgi:hypothetical protein
MLEVMLVLKARDALFILHINLSFSRPFYAPLSLMHSSKFLQIKVGQLGYIAQKVAMQIVDQSGVFLVFIHHLFLMEETCLLYIKLVVQYTVLVDQHQLALC